MGLRERALEFQQSKLAEKNLALRPGENTKDSEPLADDWDREALEEIKSRGFVDKTTLISEQKPGETADQFLLRDDRQSSTLPATSAALMHNRVEALLNLIDLCKEIALIDDEEELWSTVLFGLLGQIGSREAAIFIKGEERFELKTEKGYKIDQDFKLLKRSSIERALTKNPSIYYAKDLVEEVVGDEKTFLKALNAELVVPIMRYEQLSGLIILGKPIGADDYHIDDLLYLKLFGELLGSFYDSITRIIEVSEKKANWEQKEQRHNRFVKLLETFQSKEVTSDSILEKLKVELKEEYKISLYMFLHKEDEVFSPLISTGFSRQTKEQFTVPASEPWLWESQHNTSWYKYVDFKKDGHLQARFSEDDFAILNSMFILPLFFNKELQGVFLLFEVNQDLTGEDLHYLQALLQNFFLLKTSEKVSSLYNNQQDGSAHDPLSALRSLVKMHEHNLAEKKVPYSLLSIQLSNKAHLENIYGPARVSEIRSEIKGIISNELDDETFLSEIFPGQLLAVLPGYNQGDSWSLTKLLQKRVKQAYIEEEKRPLFKSKILVRPDEKLVDIANFLFD